MSKKETIKSILDCKSDRDLQLLFNPKARYKRVKFFLDTKYNVDTYEKNGVHKWKISNSKPKKRGEIYINGLRNIVGMKMGEFKMNMILNRQSPYFYIGDKSYEDNTGIVTVLIDELKAQSFIGPDNDMFHFMFNASGTRLSDTTTFSSYELINQSNNNGYFWFREPITKLSSITLRYGIPFKKIKIEQAFQKVKVIQQSNPMRVVHNLPSINLLGRYPDMKFKIVGFDTGDPVADKEIIEQVTNYYGKPSGGILVDLQFPFDLSSTTPLPGDLYVTLDFGDYYRQIIPMEFIYLDNELT